MERQSLVNIISTVRKPGILITSVDTDLNICSSFSDLVYKWTQR